MESTAAGRTPRLTAVLRNKETVTPLELFFDLVFVLALTQCTALMAEDPTWEGLARGLLILGVLWWSWVGYSWLTSVVDPEEGVVRLAIFGAMAALLVAARCACRRPSTTPRCCSRVAYGAVRIGQIVLFVAASQDDPNLRSSVIGLAGSTALGVGILTAASFTDGALQGAPVGAGPGAGHGRAVLLRLRGLEARPRALRRAPRADHHHRPRRVDRRHRGGRVHRGRRRRGGCRSGRHAGGGRAVVAVLRRGRAGGRTPAVECGGRARAERDRARLLSPSCTCRWWPASSWWRWA